MASSSTSTALVPVPKREIAVAHDIEMLYLSRPLRVTGYDCRKRVILYDVRVISHDARVIFHVALNVYCSMSCLLFGLGGWAQRRIAPKGGTGPKEERAQRRINH